MTSMVCPGFPNNLQCGADNGVIASAPCCKLKTKRFHYFPFWGFSGLSNLTPINLKKLEKMVLPGRIELPASPLPRECSTPELRQQVMEWYPSGFRLP